jgi:SAM-dependent methyltransferase
MVTVDFSWVKLPPGSRVLDIGCGSGRHTAAAGLIPGTIVVGVDATVNELAAARCRLEFHERLGAYHGDWWSLCAGDCLHLPFGGGRFDLAICSEVLEHIPNHSQAVMEIARVLRPGGNAVVSVPRYGPERLCWALARDYALVKGGHIRIYSKQGLMALLKQAGLQPWAAHHAHSLHTPYWWLKCLMGPDHRDAGPVKIYHRFLTWDLMQRPRCMQFLERLLNPILGKSLVIYSKKAL